jgi:carotenoid 1,2-hydratase
VSWKDGVLRYQINERCTPFGQRLSGEIAAYPGPACPLDVDLDGQGRHHWTPWSPHARVAVKLNHPQLAWEGNAYLDANAGSEPLERAFHSWDWSRTEYADRSRLHYEVQLRNGQERLFAFDIDAQGQAEEVTADPVESLRRTGWGLQRYPRCGHGIGGVQSFEDTPFYSRTLLRGPEASPISVHERLSMDRFVAPWVRCLLPFRMPRELAGSRQPRAHRS